MLNVHRTCVWMKHRKHNYAHGNSNYYSLNEQVTDNVVYGVKWRHWTCGHNTIAICGYNRTVCGVKERRFVIWNKVVHLESKKTRHQTLSHNFTSYYPIFKIFFTSGLGSKFATNLCLNIPPRFKHVATLPCEIWVSENGIIVKYVLQLIMKHKVV